MGAIPWVPQGDSSAVAAREASSSRRLAGRPCRASCWVTIVTKEMTHAWMFLAVPFDIMPVGLADVIAAADGINHVIPTRTELRVSLGWLRAQGLIQRGASPMRVGREWQGARAMWPGREPVGETCYSLTEAGIALWQACHARPILKMWNAVAKRLAPSAAVTAPEEDFTDRELAAAYETYRKRCSRRDSMS